MAPVAGSAYTYAYTTMGELFAWIIGWDLVLEYAVGAATVANGWSGYFQSVLSWIRPVSALSRPFPRSAYATAPALEADTDEARRWADVRVTGSSRPASVRSTCRPSSSCAIVTVVLVKGIQESAGFNALMVVIKVAAVLFVILVGAFFINPDNWTSRSPPSAGRGISFFGIPVLRSDQRAAASRSACSPGRRSSSSPTSASTRSPPTPRRPRTRSATCRSASSPRCSICTVLYIAVVAVLTGMVPYDQIEQGRRRLRRLQAERAWAGPRSSSPPPAWPASPRCCWS